MEGNYRNGSRMELEGEEGKGGESMENEEWELDWKDSEMGREWNGDGQPKNRRERRREGERRKTVDLKENSRKGRPKRERQKRRAGDG